MTEIPAVIGSTGRKTAPAAREVVIRSLSSDEDFRACLELQKLTWGDGFTECVPPTILKVSQRIGGVAAGAFDSGGRMLGFVFGMTGLADGEAVHWSDMLAVRPEARHLGLGQRLKQFQADLVRRLNVTRMYWTFDPLVARNAHLNLNKLGARVVSYEQDMYGSTESDLHRVGTDRFVVAWRFDEGETDVSSRGISARAEDTPVLNRETADSLGAPGAEVVRIEIPLDIEAVQRESLRDAVEWRSTTRAAFMRALEQGYDVTGFYRHSAGGPCYYVLSRRSGGEAGEE